MIETSTGFQNHRRKSSRLIGVLFLIFIIVLLAICALVFIALARSAFSKPSNVASLQTITISSGESVQQLSTDLAAQGEIPSAFWMRMYLKLHPTYASLQAGSYVIPVHSTIRQIALQLHTTVQQTTLRITEGATINDIAADIAKDSSLNITAAQVIIAEQQLASTYAFLGQTNHPATLEGYLFPDTYFIANGSTATQILQKMLDNEDQKITPTMLAEMQSKNVTPQQVITIASLIEKEIGTTGTARDPQTVQQEREIVAGILYNRLNKGMSLQLDSTKLYAQPGLTQPDPSYNTYVIPGLPPGPISNPSLDSIEAAINPTQSSYLYFITDKTGTAHFASTLDEQNKNIAEYLQ